MSTSRVYTVGQVLTAAQVNDLPQGLLGIATNTAGVGPTSGTTPLDILSAPAVTVAGSTRRIKITFSFRALSSGTSGDLFIIAIQEGATVLKDIVVPIDASSWGEGCDFSVILNPTAASHTYKATIVRNFGTGTAIVNAAATSPITIAVEDIGQV